MAVKKDANRLRMLRAEHQISQLEAARQMGTHQLRWWRIEHGYADPTPEECKLIAKILKVKVADLGLPACKQSEAVTK